MTLVYDLDALRRAQSGLSDQHTALSEVSDSMSSTGAGPTEMYGILVGQIAHPLLQLTVDNGAGLLAALSSLLDSFSTTMANTVASYQATEQDNVDRTAEIAAELGRI